MRCCMLAPRVKWEVARARAPLTPCRASQPRPLTTSAGASTPSGCSSSARDPRRRSFRAASSRGRSATRTRP
eukprot:15475208-Alexandrium_andersonii.AAC.1